ncbi:MAG: putative metal-dependent hydrolase [Winogradskyella sp.]|uniref:YfiT family bacillithiol transferase n=1 Tax=Winogradskyella sp. TaxID=1883156 RepID=UPI0017C149DA|nr:putative metal-dependent hydrolase [Winogradskyella sp.]
MTKEELYALRFPIGEFIKPDKITKEHLNDWVITIENFPLNIDSLINSLNEHQLKYRYRPNGWTIKQVVHHCADSHMNSIIRFKLALTEDKPTIKPYFEDRFANLEDYEAPMETSQSILKGVHKKLSILLRSLNTDELKRTFLHPDHGKYFTIAETIGMYAWHSSHHLAHIKQALKYEGNFK